MEAVSTVSAAAELTSAWVVRVARRDGLLHDLLVSRTPGCVSPIYAASGSIVVAFGGALNDRRALADTLGLTGSLPSDAMLVLRAYERWGENCAEHLRGIFGLVIADRARQRVFGARDRVGVHPLFWAWSGDDLLLSSSIQSLLGEPGVSRTLNRPAMVDHIRHTWGDHPQETFFEAVRRVPAGHSFEVVDRQFKVRPYWSILKYGQEVDWLAESDADQFHEMLDRAVGRCLQFGRGAIFLSGGFDSVSVAAAAVNVAQKSGDAAPLALSLAFPHVECNEESVQRGVAGGLGLQQIMLPFGDAVAPDGLIWSGMALGARLSAPLTNTWGAAYYRLRVEADRRGCEVVMTGNGGDDWLTVEPIYIADLMRHGNVSDLLAMLRNQLRSYDLPRLALLRTLLWRYGTRPLLSMYAGRLLRKVAPGFLRTHRARHLRAVTPSWLAPDPELQRASEERHERVQAALDARPAPTGRYGFFHFEEPRGFIRPAIAMEFEEVFEQGRHTGTLELAPYWDADLVEFLHRIPPKVLDRGGRAKGLVRETVAKRFPKLGFDSQRKVSAAGYFKTLLATEGPVAWNKLGNASALVKLGVVSSELNEELNRGFANRDILLMQRSLDMMGLEAWARSRAA